MAFDYKSGSGTKRVMIGTSGEGHILIAGLGEVLVGCSPRIQVDIAHLMFPYSIQFVLPAQRWAIRLLSTLIKDFEASNLQNPFQL